MAEKHFTYSAELDRKLLKQGDILKKTDELMELLKKYHSFYATTSEYTHFQVLTQTCDLVRRGDENSCSSRYITLAAIRSLDTVIKRAIDNFAEKKIIVDEKTFCSDKHRDKLKSVIDSLFNNNDKDFFFLKASPYDGLLDDSCTFLHLSIAIRAYEHYDLCLRAKLLELEENFRAKLGWMVGNLYSRVGTEDYVPAALPDRSAFDALIEDTLEKHIGWVPQDAFAEFKKAAKPGRTFEIILKNAQDALEAKRNGRISSLVGLLNVHAELTSEQREKIRIFLESHQGQGFIK